MSNLKNISLLIFMICNIMITSAKAGIYEYVDETGVSNFSDIQVDDRYELIQETVTDSPIRIGKYDEVSPHNSSSLNADQQRILYYIKRSATNNQIESELIRAIIQVESAFKIKAKSSKGAQGLMQLMPATANSLGVKNSYDPAQNIEGGAKHLKKLIALFKGDIRLALAAYNAGENAVIRHGYTIPPYKETQTYVPKVLAIYEFFLSQRNNPLP